MNVTARYQFTIVVPVFNERENLERLEQRLSAYLTRTAAKPACVLFVDDGSTDGGGELLAGLCQRHLDFFYLRFAHNGG